jgi:Uma2 family endonuclease
MTTAVKPFSTFEDYLAFEETSETKHEFVNGEIRAMSGARDEHVTVSLNVATLLKSHLRGGPCRLYAVDMKVKVVATGNVFYPDVVVTYDPADHASKMFKTSPKFIVEVLSDSTAAYDRGDKFAEYQKLPSLEEYVLIEPLRRRVECFRRQPDGSWNYVSFDETAVRVVFSSLAFDAAMDDIYEDVDVSGQQPVVSSQ